MHFYLLNYILCIYKYLACVYDNKYFADKLTFFCCSPAYLTSVVSYDA